MQQKHNSVTPIARLRRGARYWKWCIISDGHYSVELLIILSVFNERNITGRVVVDGAFNHGKLFISLTRRHKMKITGTMQATGCKIEVPRLRYR